MELFEKPRGVGTRWFSPENPLGEPGRGGVENRGAKGRPYVGLPAGGSVELMALGGSGTVCRIWATVSDRSAEAMRSLRIEMFWDGCATPAVSAPFGDFFGVGLGRRAAFESALFSDPEGRSFNCFVPMPFRTGARVVATNEGARDVSHLFYDVDVLTGVEHPAEALYFHACWRRERPNALGEEFAILPFVAGSGRFLGCNAGVACDPRYEGLWWGEGEVKVRLGGERGATLCGTGTEDYVGTAWGQGRFAHRTQGCPVAEEGLYAFYRYHLDDPVFFDGGCQVGIQTMGGGGREAVLRLLDAGVPMVPAAVDAGRGMVPLLAGDVARDPRSVGLPEHGCNFWRQDDWSATAYFYLDRPESGLPPLAPVAERAAGLR